MSDLKPNPPEVSTRRIRSSGHSQLAESSPNLSAQKHVRLNFFGRLKGQRMRFTKRGYALESDASKSTILQQEIQDRVRRRRVQSTELQDKRTHLLTQYVANIETLAILLAMTTTSK